MSDKKYYSFFENVTASSISGTYRDSKTISDFVEMFDFSIHWT